MYHQILKFTQIQLLLAIIFSLFTSLPVNALPGETLQQSMARFRGNPLFKGLNFQTDSTEPGLVAYLPVPVKIYMIPYTNSVPPVSWKSEKFTVDLYSDRTNTVLNEGVYFPQTSIAKTIAERRYDPRQDTEIIELLTSVWGSEIAADFKLSRFTDIFKEAIDFRRLYQGNKFGYQLKRSGSSVRIDIFSLVFLPERRLMTEYEERL
ncbi:MAG TPA: hypothetical protein V6D28_25100 [Leptolyngbyaceae cyanobacterium]